MFGVLGVYNFGTDPRKNDPEIDKLNSWFNLIGPLSIINFLQHMKI